MFIATNIPENRIGKQETSMEDSNYVSGGKLLIRAGADKYLWLLQSAVCTPYTEDKIQMLEGFYFFSVQPTLSLTFRNIKEIYKGANFNHNH